MKHSVKNDLLYGCPKHDHVYVKYKNSPWTRVEEHELRFIGLQIAKGYFDPEDIIVKEVKENYIEFDERGYIAPGEYMESNIFSLNGDFSRDKMRIHNPRPTDKG